MNIIKLIIRAAPWKLMSWIICQRPLSQQRIFKSSSQVLFVFIVCLFWKKSRCRLLNWRRRNKDRDSKLFTAAKRVLWIPSTSTPSEWIFSKAGFIVNKTQRSLLQSNVDRLVFLYHNNLRLTKNSTRHWKVKPLVCLMINLVQTFVFSTYLSFVGH